MYPSLKPQNSGDNGPAPVLPPPPQPTSTRRNSGGNSITKNSNGVTSIKILTPPSSSVPSPPIGLSSYGSSGSLGALLKTSTPNKYNDPLNAFVDDCADDELELSIPESDSVPSQLPPRRLHGHHRSNRIGLSVSASSSPEAGVSPHTLAEQGWKSFDGVDEDKWIEEGRMLIEPGDDDDDDDCDPCHGSKGHESDEDEDDLADIWSMSKDQQEYYIKQFQLLLGPNGGSKVSGPIAKDLFLRSKLTSSELSTIWILSDIDKDGYLNLAEFSIAMHLIVMRKKASVDVPTTLPKSLLSSALKISPAIINHGDESHSNGHVIKSNSNKNLIDMSSSPRDLPVSGHFENPILASVRDQNKEWTKFTDSPTARKNKIPINGGNSLIQTDNSLLNQSGASSADDSSSGLVNFDFPSSSIGSNPSIVHPVALRLTPEGQCLIANTEPIVGKCSSGKTNQTIIPPPIPPPRPPARTTSGHARSSSLDLNKLQGNNRRSTWSSNGNGQFYYGMASQPPNITSMSPSNLIVDVKQDHHGAFEVYKKGKSPLPPPPPTKSDSVPEKDHSRTLKVIQSQFGLEPFPSLIPSNPCDMNELKQCLKLSNDRINRLEQINQILMEKLAETVDKNIELESKYSRLRAAADLIRNNHASAASSTTSSSSATSVITVTTIPPTSNHHQPNHSINNGSSNSVQCTKI